METLYFNIDICNVHMNSNEKIFTSQEFYIFCNSIKYAEIDNGELDIIYLDGKNQRFVLANIKDDLEKNRIKIGWGYLKNYNEVLEMLKLSKIIVKK